MVADFSSVSFFVVRLFVFVFGRCAVERRPLLLFLLPPKSASRRAPSVYRRRRHRYDARRAGPAPSRAGLPARLLPSCASLRPRHRRTETSACRGPLYRWDLPHRGPTLRHGADSGGVGTILSPNQRRDGMRTATTNLWNPATTSQPQTLASVICM